MDDSDSVTKHPGLNFGFPPEPPLLRARRIHFSGELWAQVVWELPLPKGPSLPLLARLLIWLLKNYCNTSGVAHRVLRKQE